MYSSRGGNAYGQQPPPSYSSQSAYTQNLGASYSGNSVGGYDKPSQLSVASLHSSILGGRQEADTSGYRTHPSTGAHYGGQYGSLYGSAAQQVPSMSTKGPGPSALEARVGFGSSISGSPKFAFGDFLSSSGHGYAHKSDQLYSDKISDYPSMDRRQYGDRQTAYIGRELQSEPSVLRYADSVSFSRQQQPDIYDRIDQASQLRKEQMLKTQALQSTSLDGGPREADYLTSMGATIRQPTQDLMSYTGRMDVDPRSLSMLSGSSYGGQHTPSILGAVPKRGLDDHMYTQSSSNPGYGVSLPPGRNYGTGKGLRGTSLELEYPGGLLTRGGNAIVDERKDDRGGYAQELDQREDERCREHLREREKDKEREKARERERKREREKERERERERKREREREREHERKRISERREKEKDQEHKHALEIKRERTPIRISRDRRNSLLSKERRPLPRESPRHDALHRHRSPVKEKRREYICKVYSSSLVDVERDYLSLDKRYPRLFVSPECAKVVVNWPRENIKLALQIPVSFEHYFVEESATEQKVVLTEPSTDEIIKSEHRATVWNAKVILMSGLSQNSLEELASDRRYDDRVPHFCNLLRFAVLKKNNSLMAIGGPWSSIDGGDPSVDDSSLVRTVLRYAKDLIHLDFKDCQHWNRFLEIHYDRVGKDGLFSHREVTVLYVPDLSDCLPSFDTWREQWFAHKNAFAESECQKAQNMEKSRDKKKVNKEIELEPVKDVKGVDKAGKKESISAGEALNVKKKDKDGIEAKENEDHKDDGKNDKKVEKKDTTDVGKEGNNIEEKGNDESACVKATVSGKLVKKKIIKRIVKRPVAEKKGTLENETSQTEKLDNKDAGENANSEVGGQQESSANVATVKTFIRKKVAKKVVGEVSQEVNENMQCGVKADKETECSEDKVHSKLDTNSVAEAKDATVKKIIKKKIIRRVPKRKVPAVGANNGTDSNKDGDKSVKNEVEAKSEVKTMREQVADAINKTSEAKEETHKAESETSTPEKQDNVDHSNKTASKDGNKDSDKGKRAVGKSDPVPNLDIETDGQKLPQTDHGKREKSKERENSKNGKETKDKSGKDNFKSKSSGEMKETRKPEEPARHPGFILQTKGSKDLKLQSLSLSLDSLLGYTDNDLEESSFELSLFAESLYEMLQYQMGCRLLTFLKKLRIKFVTKRNQRKRQRDENVSKEKENKSSTKRVKTVEVAVEMKSEDDIQGQANPDDGRKSEPETQDGAHTDNGRETATTDLVENADAETGADEDPEEDPEEDEEMPDVDPRHNSFNEDFAEGEIVDGCDVAEATTKNEIDGNQETRSDTLDTEPKGSADGKEKITEDAKKEISDATAEDEKREITNVKVNEDTRKDISNVDKKLLQAFRFFDRNRVGYIRVEDMRLILHNLGKFLSHRDVKELVQSALLESNTGRDDRILYDKLVRMSCRLRRQNTF